MFCQEMRARQALEARKLEEAKRKQYEGRMTRKAKREGKDPSFYLRQGAENPSVEVPRRLRAMPREVRDTSAIVPAHYTESIDELGLQHLDG